ncbi:polysaccharide deacetylase family protein [Thermohalobacter berrensis]|uniref:Polysaccharide deacetylase n=1 Tax=Thermohalobacter berrensis TaxID=99594 RepID=A0A419TAJ1_9FIRM|nr:polysaccharide deacetylase family protein [Thermohalobacter berrensis]RKD34485.1 polysaccharide deacetylase [Thermohalobacter berrensis]
MQIYYIKYKTIYKLLIIVVLVLLILSIALTYKNKAINTFKNDDVYYKGNIDKEVIAFTCNVDWGNEYIKPMLKIFKENSIKITFFVTGRWAEKNEKLIKLIYNEGHEIGNHGYLHRDYSKLSYELNKKEILKTQQIVKDILGVKTKYFAPPAGAYSDKTVRAAKDLNHEVIMWSIDTIDWRKDSTKDKIINRVISKAHNSAIVLMHPKKETVKALPIIINKLKEKGYKVGRVSDIIK